MNTQALQKRKAAVFTCYKKGLEQLIQERLEKYDIEAVRYIDPNKSTSYSLSDVDLVIIIMELMSGVDAKKIHENARRLHKPVVRLHRNASDWDRAFAKPDELKFIGGTIPVTPGLNGAPFSSTKPAPPPSSPPFLQLVPPASKSSPEVESKKDNLDDYKQMIALYESEHARIVEENQRLTVQNETAAQSTALLTAQNKALVDASEALTKEVDKLQKKLKSLSSQGEVDISKALEHFKALWKMGYVSPEDVLKMIFKEK